MATRRLITNYQTMFADGGIPSYIKNGLAFLTAMQIGAGRYYDIAGTQRRDAWEQNGAVGEDFEGAITVYNGTDQQSRVADNGALDVNQASTDFVLTGVYKNNDVAAASKYIFGKNLRAGGDGSYGFEFDGSGNLVFGFSTSNGYVAYDTLINAADLTSNLLTARIDLANSKVYVYVDGVVVVNGTSFTGTPAILSNSLFFYMGAGNDDSPAGDPIRFSDCQLRDVRVYHKDITSAANFAALQRGEQLHDEVGWWWCEEGDLYETFDSSGNGYHMTNANFTANSYTPANVVSLRNKFGYGINVYGPNFILNEDFSAWTGDDPDDWVVANESAENYVTEHANGARWVYETAFPTALRITQDGKIIGRKYRRIVTVTDYVSGGVLVYDGASINLGEVISNGTFSFDYTATETGIYFYRKTGTDIDLIFNEVTESPYHETSIPADMSTTYGGTVPTKDIFGNDLVFKGSHQPVMAARQRSCFQGNDEGYFTKPPTGLTDLDVTIKIKISVADSGAHKYLYGSYDATNPWWFRINQGATLRFYSLVGATSREAITTDTLSIDTWYTLRLTSIVGDDIRIYIDGTEVSYTTQEAAQALDATNEIQVFGYASPNGIPDATVKYLSDGEGQYEFVEGLGNTVYDVGGDGNHLAGQNTSDANWTTIDFPENDYLAEYGGNFVGRFNGVDDYIDLDSDIVIDRTADTSIFARVHKLGMASTDYILANSLTNLYSRFLINGSGEVYLESDTNGDDAITNTAPCANPGWYDIEVRVNNSVISVLVNGVNQTMGDSSITDDITLDRINGANSVFSDQQIAYIKIKNNTTGAFILNMPITGFLSTETDTSPSGNNGTWAGTGIHTAIIPANSGGALGNDAAGWPLVYKQNGPNLIPETYFSMPDNDRPLYDADNQERFEGGLMDEGMGTFNDDTTESWAAYGSNIIENDNKALKITGVDNVAGAITALRATSELGTDLVVDDEYKFRARVKVNIGTSVNLRISGPDEDSDTITSTEWIWVEIIFTATHATTNSIICAQNLNVGEILWIDTWILFHKTQQTGNNLIANGGARNDVGALTTTDWRKTTGLMDIIAFEDHASTIDGATKVRTLGDEMNPVPEFSSATGWDDFGSSHSITGGKFVVDGSAPGNEFSRMVNAGLEPLKSYFVEFKIENYVSGSVRLSTVGIMHAGSYTGNGVFRAIIIRGTSTPTHFYFYSYDAGAQFDIDYLYVKEITTATVEDQSPVTTGRLIDQIPQGAEEVANAEFDSATGWLGANWVVSGGVATATATNDGLRRDDTSFESGKYYILEYKINSVSAGSIFARVGVGGSLIGSVNGTPGTYTETFRYDPNLGTSPTRVELRYSTTFTGVVEYLRIRELQVLGSDLVTDGDMSVPGSWGIGANWAISGGVATHSIGAGTAITQNLGSGSNSLILVKLDFTGTAGYINVGLGGTNFGWINDYSTGKELIFETGGDNDILSITADSDYDGDVDNVSVHVLTWGRQITDDSANYAGFQYALPIDEFDFAIPVTYAVESIVAQQFHDGIADGFGIGVDAIAGGIVTGNGFSSKTQRIIGRVGTSTFYMSLPVITLVNGDSYYIRFKYRSSVGIQFSNGISLDDGIQAANPDDAILFEGFATASYDGPIGMRVQLATADVDDWFEIDELEFRRVIDPEFYEPEVFGGDPVVVAANYIIENPWRYLTRYYNPTDRKDLMLVAPDSGFTDAHHEQILEYTKNT